MSIFKKVISELDLIENSIEEWAKNAVTENKDEIISILKNKQLSKGLDSSNRVIGVYSPNTEEYAARDNITTPKTPGMPYNLYWSGETIENLYVKSINKKLGNYSISTSIKKKRLLEGLYGEIFELSEENNKFVNENIITPYIYDKIKKFKFNI